MRLHHLELTAFGPFASTLELDLERVSAAGLFLIHGPTGSGKTSLLDAICFALYANVPGDRHAASLRSQHAAEGDPTGVRLELTLSGRRLRITRRPPYERPKKRGTGTTNQPATVQLEEFRGGAWHTLSSRIDESAQILDDLLGMGLDQFRRVVMLPQGDFAAFLRATDEERREVLERLFDVTDYVGVEAWLVDQRQRAQKVLVEGRSALAGHVARMTELLAETEAPLPEDGDPWGELGPEELTALTEEVDAALAAHNDELMAGVDRANQANTAARTALDRGRRTADVRARGLRATATLDELAQTQDAHADRRRRLTLGRDAAAVVPFVSAARRTSRALHTARQEHLRARDQLPQELSEADLEGWLARVHEGDDALTTARHGLDHLARQARQAPLLDERIQQRRRVLDEAVQAVEAARAQAEDTRVAAEQIETAGVRLAAVAPELTRLNDLVAARSAVTRAEDDVRRVTDVSQTRRQSALDLRARVQGLIRARLETMAGELAAQLVDGQACGVCGSTSHPDPARASELVTPEQIEAAEAAAETASSEHELARAEREAVAAGLELARAKVAAVDVDGDAPSDLTETLAALENERAALTDVVDRREAVRHALDAVTDSITEAEDVRARATTELAGARARRDQVAEEIRDAARRGRHALDVHATACPCGVLDSLLGTALEPAPDPLKDHNDPETVAAQLEALRQTEENHAGARSLGAAVLTAREELTRARRADAEAGRFLEEALAESGFTSRDAVLDAALERATLDDLARCVEDHEHRLSGAREVLAEEDVPAALDAVAPDLVKLAATAEGAHAIADAAGRRQASAQTVVRQFVAIAGHVRQACARIGPASERANLVQRMSDLATGTSRDNDKRMRLSTYVLAARLERIVELANERLAAMADGRYELAHDDASARGQRRGGLGLVVCDLWTGFQRPTDTLSGGESFTTSLALALGLADAIREESGGQEFGTLFVDEGFGSLDPESLEQVLDVLDRLRDGGRAVGVVSHVHEMRTRIPTQIRVNKTQRGSSVTVFQAADDVA